MWLQTEEKTMEECHKFWTENIQLFDMLSSSATEKWERLIVNFNCDNDFMEKHLL